MKAIQVELPDKLAAEINVYVNAGWFGSEGEVVRAALIDFVKRHRIDLLERFMRDDIEWALRTKGYSCVRVVVCDTAPGWSRRKRV